MLSLEEVVRKWSLLAEIFGKAREIWQEFATGIVEYADQVVETLSQTIKPVNEALDIWYYAVLEPVEKLTALSTLVEKEALTNNTSPMKHRTSLRSCPRRAYMRYNYIPVMARNLPYQRRIF